MNPSAVGVLVAACALAAWSPWRVRRASAGGARRRCPGRRAQGPPPRGGPADVPPVDAALLLDLCAAAVRGGAAVPRALVVTGRHLGGDDGAALVRVGTALGLGTPWGTAWAAVPAPVAALGDALRDGQDAGASPAVRLRSAAARVRRERRTRARSASAALGVRLTLPLGLCFLPAFVLLGLAPVVLGLASDLLGR